MSAWGIGIYENDTAEDVRTAYFKLQNRGKSSEEVQAELLEMFSDVIADSDDAPLFWMALADQQWKSGMLTELVKQNALDAIKLGIDLHQWYAVSPEMGNRRKLILYQLQQQLETPSPKKQPLHSKKTYTCSWNVGDVFAFPLSTPIELKDGSIAKYIMFQVGGKYLFGEKTEPVVRCWMSKTPHMHEVISFIKSMPCQNIDGTYTYAYHLIGSEKKMKLIPIGNYPVQKADDDSGTLEKRNFDLAWKFFEEKIVKAYRTEPLPCPKFSKLEAEERLSILKKNFGLDNE